MTVATDHAPQSDCRARSVRSSIAPQGGARCREVGLWRVRPRQNPGAPRKGSNPWPAAKQALELGLTRPSAAVVLPAGGQLLGRGTGFSSALTPRRVSGTGGPPQRVVGVAINLVLEFGHLGIEGTRCWHLAGSTLIGSPSPPRERRHATASDLVDWPHCWPLRRLTPRSVLAAP
jgi:hypothetical protein